MKELQRWFALGGAFALLGASAATVFAFNGPPPGSPPNGDGSIVTDAYNRIGIGGAPTSKLSVNQGTLQLTGSSQVAPTSGAGLELLYNGANSAIYSYNRSTPGYLPLEIRGSTVNINSAGGTGLFINASNNVGLGTTNPESFAVLDIHTTPPNKGIHIWNGTEGGLLVGYGGPRVQGRTAADGNGDLLLNPYGGNIGVGVVSPAQKLDVAGTVQATGFKMPTGAASGYVLTSDASGVGAWTAAPGAGTWSVSGSNIYNTNSGNVGIGTNAPATKLDVDSNSNASAIRVRGADGPNEVADIYVAAGGALTLSTANTGAASAYIQIDPEDDDYGLILRDGGTGSSVYTNFYMNDAATDYLNITVGTSNSTPGLVVQSGNNVGIGVTTPSQKLELSGNMQLQNANVLYSKNTSGTAEGFLWPRWSDNVTYMNFGSGGLSIRNNASASRLFIQDDGDVGVGTVAPVYKLDVSGDINATGVYRKAGVAGSTVTCPAGQVFDGATVSGGIVTGGTCTSAASGDITGVTAGNGLTGGGATGAVTLDIGVGSGISVAADAVSVDSTVARTNAANVFGAFDQTFDTNTLFVDVSGDAVGIGIALPNEKLEIANATGGRVAVSDAAGAERRVLLLQAPTAAQDYARILGYKYGTGSGGKNLILQDSGGNVGIGTVAPVYKLDVSGDINATGVYRRAGVAGSTVTCPAGQVLKTPIVSGGIITGGACAADDAGAGGDITGITAGTGLLGGGISGDVTISLSAPVSVANGGTGASTAVAARTNLSAAVSGANNDITSITGLTTPLSVTQGGTAQVSYITGDIIYASAANTISKRAIGSSGQVLTVSGGVPTWATPASGMGGSGTANTVAKFTAGDTLGNSQIVDNGTNVGIGAASPTQKLEIAGNLKVDGAIVAPEGTLRDDGGGWVRTYGATGWYSQTFGGGWYMSDATWLRSYANKSIYSGSGTIRTDGLFDARINGNVQMTLYDTSGYAAGAGAGVWLGSEYNSAASVTSGAGMTAEKTNSTDGDYSYDLALWTRVSGAGATEKLRILNNGNVGIGTAAPAQKLDVAGTVQMTGLKLTTGVTDGYVLKSNAAGVGTWQQEASGLSPTLSSGNIFVGNVSNIATGVAMSGDATISNAGAVTIGANAVALGADTTGNYVAGNTAGDGIAVTGVASEGWSPTIAVDSTVARTNATNTFSGAQTIVGGDLSANNYLRINSWGGTYGTGAGRMWFDGVGGSGNATGYLSIGANADSQLNIQVGGNVGVGTINPGQKLTVVGTIESTSGGFKFPDGTTQTTAASSGLGGSGTTSYLSKFTAGTTLGNSQIFDNGTNVGIGTASPGQKLAVAGNLDISTNRLGFGGNVGVDSTAGINWHTSGSTNYAIYRSSGAWSAPDYQQLTLDWPTGIVMNPGSSYGKSYVDIQGGGLRVTSGNVGIGTINPGAKLEVAGQVKITGGSPGLNKVLTSDGTGLASWQTTASAPVSSVFGRTGAVAAASGDYTTTQVTEGTNLYFTNARAQSAMTGGASTITTSNLVADSALISNASGKVAVSSSVSATELGYLDGVTSGIQTQLNSKLSGIVGVANGGTGQTTYATGDILYASAPGTLSKRAIGSDGQVMAVSSGAPTWQNPGTANSNFGGMYTYWCGNNGNCSSCVNPMTPNVYTGGYTCLPGFTAAPLCIPDSDGNGDIDSHLIIFCYK